MNKAILIGNVGNDPEIRTLENEVRVATFSLATSEFYTKKGGEKVTQTTWHKIEVWNGLVKVAESLIDKGDRLSVDGKIIMQKYTDKEGIERTAIKIRAERIELLGKKRDKIESQAEPTEAIKQDAEKDKTETLPNEGKAFVFNADNANGNPADDLPF